MIDGSDLVGGPPSAKLLRFGKGSGHCFVAGFKGAILKGIEVPYNRGLHRFAIFVACATFVLIIAGALVTSNDAGLSIPDWPRSFGSFSVPELHGGVQYEWSHRAIAGSIILLTISIAGWTFFADRRRWMKWLGIAALGTVITQAVLGGLTVLLFQPPWVSTAHATVAQTFFCIAVAIAVFTGRRWVEEHPRTELDQRRPALFTLTVLSIFVLYVQLILGAMFRHHGMSWWPHVVNAGVVAIVLSWTAIRAISVYSNVDAVRRPAIAMLGLMVAQLCLGFLAFITRVMWGRDAAQPETPMVTATVTHVAVGALLLATTVVLAIQVWRHVPVAFEERVAGEDPVAA
ncbi:MAG: COX15/CtaA family protein [Terriglobales bacterium]